MAGHSKWAQINHKKKKKAIDAKCGQLFTKLARAIQVAAREGGADPDGNPALANAIQKAKDARMPNENIERAIAKGSADAGSEEQEVYDGYGPDGVAIMVEASTNPPANAGRRSCTPAAASRGEAGTRGVHRGRRGGSGEGCVRLHRAALARRAQAPVRVVDAPMDVPWRLARPRLEGSRDRQRRARRLRALVGPVPAMVPARGGHTP